MYKYIYKRKDGSYLVEKNGLPYHVPNIDGWKEEWNAVDKYAKAHPENVAEEPEPAEPTLDELKAIKLSEINVAYDTATSSLVSNYPETELLTFGKQESEARAYASDHSASTPFLSGLAKARGITLDDLVGRVIRKSEAFASAVATLTGQRQRYEDLLGEAKTAEEIEAIVPEYHLPQGMNL